MVLKITAICISRWTCYQRSKTIGAVLVVHPPEPVQKHMRALSSFVSAIELPGKGLMHTLHLPGKGPVWL